MGPKLPELPTSVGESRTYYQGVAASSMHDLMSLSQAGYVDFGFLGAAQMDQFGNINTTVIGEHEHPAVRLPGSGGANDVASFSHRLITIMAKQSTRTFVERVDFITTSGYLDGPGARERSCRQRVTQKPDRAIARARSGRRPGNHRGARLTPSCSAPRVRSR